MGHSLAARLLLALVILVADWILFIVPLGALFLAYVLVARPRWFKDWLDQLYG